ncbi:MAG: hypothetical protein AM325_009730 [Candidatus Thorarchaeota archaeon SMTZ1-45]
MITTGIGFFLTFAAFYSYSPSSFDSSIWISYVVCTSLSISVGLSFIALTYLFSRGCGKLFMIACSMIGFVLVMGYLMNPFRFGNIVVSVMVFGVVAALEIAFVFTQGVTILEDMRKALYPENIE